MQFIALLHPPEGASMWGVTFPDLPGCVSSGKSFEEASANASEALRGHLAAMRSDSDKIPSARMLKEIQADRSVSDELEGAFPLLVDENVLLEPAL